MSDAAKAKIRQLSQQDIPIQQRRALYNKLDRRIKRGGLKAGLVEKYAECIGNSRARFAILREFLISEDL